MFLLWRIHRRTVGHFLLRETIDYQQICMAATATLLHLEICDFQETCRNLHIIACAALHSAPALHASEPACSLVMLQVVLILYCSYWR